MAWRRLNVCVGLLLLLLAEPPKAKGDAAPTFQPATLPTSTHTPEIDEEYYASVGHVMVLPCDDAEGQNVTWRREKTPPLGVDGGGVRVMDGALWFLPANSSHSGVYVCKWSDGVRRVMLRVDSGVCPESTRDRYLDLSADVGRLKCKQDHIFKSDPHAHITWLKDCESLNSFERTLHIFNVSRQDGGRYTCLLHFSLEGQNYTTASTTQVYIDGSEPPSKSQVIGPRNETLVVELVDEEYYASVGHVMVLPCDDAEGQNVTWRREKAPPLGVDGGGVRVMDGALWFLPANSSHSGVYVCEWSDGVWRVMLRVDSGVCPESTRDRYLDLSADVGRLKCKQDHIFKSDPHAHITWLKDCEPLNSFERTLHIFNVSRQDGGRYTCLLHFSLEGQNYTSASTTEVHIDQ